MVPTISYSKENVRQHEALTNLLRLEDIDVVREQVDASSNMIILSCKHRWFVGVCPDCGHITAKVSEYLGQRTVYDAPIRGRNVRLLFDRIKLQCVDCGSHFVKPVRDLVTGRNGADKDYTYRLVEDLANSQVKDAEIVARRYGLTLDLAQDLLKAVKEKVHRQREQAIAVRTLGVDELVDQNGRDHYALVISDLDRRQVLEILPDQTKLNLTQWLYAPPAMIDLSSLESVESQRGTHYIEAVVAVRPQVVWKNRRLFRQEPLSDEQEDGRSMQRQGQGQSKLAHSNQDDEHLRYRPVPRPLYEPQEEEEEEDDEPDRYQITIAILIALITFMGAVIAWQSAFSAGNASEADFGRLYATLNAEQTQSLNKASILRNYRAYTAYTRHSQEVTLLGETPPQAATTSEENPLDMRAEAMNLATTNAIFFSPRYLERDGSYNSERQEAEMWAQAAQNLDLNPEAYIEEAAQARQETIQLVGIFIPLSIALLFYTLAEALHPAQRTWRLVVAALGSLFLIMSIIVTILVEFV